MKLNKLDLGSEKKSQNSLNLNNSAKTPRNFKQLSKLTYQSIKSENKNVINTERSLRRKTISKNIPMDRHQQNQNEKNSKSDYQDLRINNILFQKSKNLDYNDMEVIVKFSPDKKRRVIDFVHNQLEKRLSRKERTSYPSLEVDVIEISRKIKEYEKVRQPDIILFPEVTQEYNNPKIVAERIEEEFLYQPFQEPLRVVQGAFSMVLDVQGDIVISMIQIADSTDHKIIKITVGMLMLLIALISQISLTLELVQKEHKNWNCWMSMMCLFGLQPFQISQMDVRDKKYLSVQVSNLDDGSITIDTYKKKEFISEAIPQTLLQSWIIVYDVYQLSTFRLIPMVNFIVSLASCIFGFVDCRIQDFIDKIDILSWDFEQPNQIYQMIKFQTYFSILTLQCTFRFCSIIFSQIYLTYAQRRWQILFNIQLFFVLFWVGRECEKWEVDQAMNQGDINQVIRTSFAIICKRIRTSFSIFWNSSFYEQCQQQLILVKFIFQDLIQQSICNIQDVIKFDGFQAMVMKMVLGYVIKPIDPTTKKILLDDDQQLNMQYNRLTIVSKLKIIVSGVQTIVSGIINIYLSIKLLIQTEFEFVHVLQFIVIITIILIIFCIETILNITKIFMSELFNNNSNKSSQDLSSQNSYYQLNFEQNSQQFKLSCLQVWNDDFLLFYLLHFNKDDELDFQKFEKQMEYNEQVHLRNLMRLIQLCSTSWAPIINEYAFRILKHFINQYAKTKFIIFIQKQQELIDEIIKTKNQLAKQRFDLIKDEQDWIKDKETVYLYQKIKNLIHSWNIYNRYMNNFYNDLELQGDKLGNSERIIHLQKIMMTDISRHSIKQIVKDEYLNDHANQSTMNLEKITPDLNQANSNIDNSINQHILNTNDSINDIPFDLQNNKFKTSIRSRKKDISAISKIESPKDNRATHLFRQITVIMEELNKEIDVNQLINMFPGDEQYNVNEENDNSSISSSSGSSTNGLKNMMQQINSSQMVVECNYQDNDSIKNNLMNILLNYDYEIFTKQLKESQMSIETSKSSNYIEKFHYLQIQDLYSQKTLNTTKMMIVIVIQVTFIIVSIVLPLQINENKLD